MSPPRQYVTSHWTREAYDAHHALDVVLDHIKYPHLYETERGSSMIGRARTGIMELLSGMIPGRSKAGRGGVTDYAQSMGRDIYEKTMNRGMMDKAGEYAQVDQHSDTNLNRRSDGIFHSSAHLPFTCSSSFFSFSFP